MGAWGSWIVGVTIGAGDIQGSQEQSWSGLVPLYSFLYEQPMGHNGSSVSEYALLRAALSLKWHDENNLLQSYFYLGSVTRRNRIYNINCCCVADLVG